MAARPAGTAAVPHAPAAVPVQHEPGPGPDGRVEVGCDAGQAFLAERAGRDQDPAGHHDPPRRALGHGERRTARIGQAVRPVPGVQAAPQLPRPPQLGLGPQPQVRLGPLVTHPPRVPGRGRAQCAELEW